MFFKKREKIKKRVVCPIPVLMGLIQETIDIDAGMTEFDILFEGEKHKVGMASDFLHSKGGFFDTIFYLDEQEFDSFEKFKSGAVLSGQFFSLRTDHVEVVDVDRGAWKFPWYPAFEKYIVD